MMKKINRDFVKLTGEITGGDEYRIDPHQDPGAIFIDNVDLVRVLATRGFNDASVVVTIDAEDEIAYTGTGVLVVEQGYGDPDGYGLKRDELMLLGLDGDDDLLEELLQQAGWFVTFTCTRAEKDGE